MFAGRSAAEHTAFAIHQRQFVGHDRPRRSRPPAGRDVITTDAAHALAVKAHGETRNKSGARFIDHVRRVAARLGHDPDPDALLAALLHDTVEKGTATWDELRAAGVEPRLMEIVDALTERDGEPEHEYLARCAADPLALRIKRIDIEDKLDFGAGSTLSDDQRQEVRTRARRRLDLLNRLAE
jgi:hypothetical protein